ncbi:aldehyde dehydrogenase family 3 member F1-like protein, partial [Tanacetum coccineum]
MDDPKITMEEYIRLEKKARRRGKVYNWKTAMYGKIWYDEDVHDLRPVEIEFPAIVFNEALTSKVALSCKPTVSPLNNNQIDFIISFDESKDENYTVIYDKNSFSFKIIYVNDLKTDSKNDTDKVNMPSFPSSEPTDSYFDDLNYFKDFEKEFPAIAYNDALTFKLDFSHKPTVSPQHIDEFNLKNETSLSECDGEEQNVIYFNDLFTFPEEGPHTSECTRSKGALKEETLLLNGNAENVSNLQPPQSEISRMYRFSSARIDGEVCKLRKALYGLKQAPRAWYEKFSTIAELSHRFAMKDLGLLRYFLGIEVASSQKDNKIADIPIDAKAKYTPTHGDPSPDPSLYRTIVGSLILWYLHSTQFQTLLFPSTSSLDLCAYCDADWAGDFVTCKSTTGFCVFLRNSLISWKSYKQDVLSRSSTETEYRAMAVATSEIIARNTVFYEWTKHIDIDCHFTRHHLPAGTISLPFVMSSLQIVDLLTNPH